MPEQRRTAQTPPSQRPPVPKPPASPATTYLIGGYCAFLGLAMVLKIFPSLDELRISPLEGLSAAALLGWWATRCHVATFSNRDIPTWASALSVMVGVFLLAFDLGTSSMLFTSLHALRAGDARGLYFILAVIFPAWAALATAVDHTRTWQSKSVIFIGAHLAVIVLFVLLHNKVGTPAHMLTHLP